MGKGNRTRNQKASALAAPSLKAGKQKRNMPTWVGTLIVVSVLVVLVLFATFVFLNQRGTFLRMRTVAESENYEITVPMMSYLIYTQFEEVVSNHQQKLEQYKELLGDSFSSAYFPIGGGTNGDNLDTSLGVQGLRDQIYERVKADDGTVVSETTWFDYFAAAAENRAKQMLVMCEEANNLGMKLEEDDLATIDYQVALIETYAQLYGYTTSGYLSTSCGTGVEIKDVRAMLEISQLSSKYAALKLQEYQDGVTPDRIDQYYNDNKETYDVYMDFVGYTFETTFTPSTKTETADKDAENAANKEKYEAEQAKYAGYVEELKAATTPEDFLNKLEQILYKEALELEKEALLKEKGEGATLTELEEGECSTRAGETVVKALVAAKSNNVKKGDDSSLSSDVEGWIFETKTEGEGDAKVTLYVRKVNDLKDFVTANKVETEGDKAYQKTTSTYSVYVVSGTNHATTGLSVGHILFKDETFKDLTSTSKLSGVIKVIADEVLARDGKVTAEAMAKRLLEVLKEEGEIEERTDVVTGEKWYYMDPDVFEQYGASYTEDSNVTYDDVVEGQMVAEFENWLFNKNRREGEITYPTAVKTEYGYHIMYYYGSSLEKAISTTLSDKDYTDYCSKLIEESNLTARGYSFNEDQLKFVCK